MNIINKRIRGMQDILPEQGEKWLNLLSVLLKESKLYGFKFIRTPVLEHTNLFERSAGSSSDIVNKEMYSFKDKSGRDVSLRPEGTAGAIRLALENGLYNNALPLKLMYHSSCYRYEKPQLGRYREFFQFGLEILGSGSSFADSEIICVGDAILKKLGIKDVKLNINTIGCSVCREKYIKILKEYFENNRNKLCKTCLERLEKNPLRILDCKDLNCSNIVNNAPVLINYICQNCLNHFNELRQNLDSLGIDYSVNTGIVRGLDYYTGVVFEFLTKFDGVYTAICGGGRYDNLAEVLGGVNLPAVGLGFGMERLLAIIESQNIKFKESEKPLVYIASVGNESKRFAEKLCKELRNNGVFVESDISDRTLKSQMKYANKIQAEYTLVLGENELRSKKALVRNMKTKQEHLISLDSNFLNEFFAYTKV